MNNFLPDAGFMESEDFDMASLIQTAIHWATQNDIVMLGLALLLVSTCEALRRLGKA